VTSPQAYGDGASCRSPEDLLRHPLLFSKSGLEWRLWAEHHGLDLDTASRVSLTDYNVVLQAAQSGAGVAMGRGMLVREHLRSGRLVQLLEPLPRSPQAAYWAVSRPRPDPNAASFVDWLASEMS
jgi:LysR family glycine cleavage system transcriptional activator